MFLNFQTAKKADWQPFTQRKGFCFLDRFFDRHFFSRRYFFTGAVVVLTFIL